MATRSQMWHHEALDNLKILLDHSGLTEGSEEWVGAIQEALDQRDELLEMCEMMLGMLNEPMGEWKGKFLAVHLRAMIAKMEKRAR